MIIDRQPEPIDHRKGPDLIVKSMKLTIILCWFLLFVVWSYVYYARPEQATIFDPRGMYNTPRSYWDFSLLKKGFFAINIMLLFSIVGMAESIFRHKRKTDKMPVTFIMMIIMSIIGMFVMYSYF